MSSQEITSLLKIKDFVLLRQKDPVVLSNTVGVRSRLLFHLCLILVCVDGEQQLCRGMRFFCRA